MTILAHTYGSLSCNMNQRDSVSIVDGNTIIFKYNMVVGNYFDDRDDVDDYDAKRRECVNFGKHWPTSL